MIVAKQRRQYLSLMIQSGKSLIKGLHSILVLTRLHHGVDLMHFVFAD